MTLEAFLFNFEQVARKHKRQWYLINGRLRTPSPSLCPLEFLTGQYGIWRSANALDLSESDTTLIVQAADDVRPELSQQAKVRQRLLKAAGLSE